MKRLGNFKDSAHFLLVINQSIQKTPPANISLLNGDLDSTLGVWTGKDPITPAVAMERKGEWGVRQKQHRALPVLALSSPFVNRETCGKVVTES